MADRLADQIRVTLDDYALMVARILVETGAYPDMTDELVGMLTAKLRPAIESQMLAGFRQAASELDYQLPMDNEAITATIAARMDQVGEWIGADNKRAIRQARLRLEGMTPEQAYAATLNTAGLTASHQATVFAAYETTYQTVYDQYISAGGSTAQAKLAAERAATAAMKDTRVRLGDWRAENMSRTEVLTAHNEGRYQSFLQAIEDGIYEPDSVMEWVATYDERTCEICGPVDGEQVPVDGLFSIGVQMPPAHNNCRCTAVLRPAGRASTAMPEYNPYMNGDYDYEGLI